MADTSNLVLPLIASEQAQKHITMNESLEALDAIVQAAVETAALSAPPAGVEGNRYIVGSSPTGAWSGHTNDLTMYLNGSWEFFEPQDGWEAWDRSTNTKLRFNGSSWAAAQSTVAVSPNGATMGFYILEEAITLSGANTTTTINIPNGAIVFNVSERVVTTVTGASSFSVGVAGNTGQFGSGLSLASGSTNIGVIGPTAFYSPTPIVVTAGGSNFTAGVVRIAIHYYLPTAPGA